VSEEVVADDVASTPNTVLKTIIADHENRAAALSDVRDIARTFGPGGALTGVSFAARKGEVLGFIGENSAGRPQRSRSVALSGTGEVLVRVKAVNVANHREALRRGLFGSSRAGRSLRTSRRGRTCAEAMSIGRRKMILVK
jgi:ABC-type phosphonate transport system ATPase subunit